MEAANPGTIFWGGRKFNFPCNTSFRWNLCIKSKGIYSSNYALVYSQETFTITPESEANSDPCQISKEKPFAKIVKGIKYQFTIFLMLSWNFERILNAPLQIIEETYIFFVNGSWWYNQDKFSVQDQLRILLQQYVLVFMWTIKIRIQISKG